MTLNEREFVTEWLQRLRSGDIAQAGGSLKGASLHYPGRVPGYCCIGVAVKVIDDLQPELFTESNCKIIETEFELALSRITEGPIAIWPSSGNLSTYETGQQVFASPFLEACTTELPSMNDRGGSFAEIADIIESTFEEYMAGDFDVAASGFEDTAKGVKFAIEAALSRKVTAWHNHKNPPYETASGE
jgi:hypothetical protein